MSRRSGFTLIETLIALAILTIAAVGPLYAVSRSLVAAQNSANVLIATHLAQEGVEYVRWMRDISYLNAFRENDPNASENAWTDFLSSDTEAWSIEQCKSSNCTLDATKAMDTGPGQALNTCSGTCAPLYLSSDGYTQEVTSTPTPFTRTIRVTQLSSTDLRVTSTVRWNFHTTPFTITVTNQLTPWQ